MNRKVVSASASEMMKNRVVTVTVVTLVVVLSVLSAYQAYAVDSKTLQKSVQSSKCSNTGCKNLSMNVATTDGKEVVQKNIQTTECVNGVCESFSKSSVTVDGKEVTICTTITKSGDVVETSCPAEVEPEPIPGLGIPVPPCLTEPIFAFPTCLAEPIPTPLVDKIKNMFNEERNAICTVTSSDGDVGAIDNLSSKLAACVDPCMINEYIDPCKIDDMEKE